MCRCCKMDPSEDARYRLRQGEIPIEDFDEEVRYRRPSRGRGYSYNKKRKREPRGCPANNNKAHVWVWTTEKEITDIFFNYFGFHKRETKVCCGCGKVSKTRETEEYMRRKERAWRKRTGGEFNVKRGEPVSRYSRYRGKSFWSFSWEMEDPKYQEIYDAWYKRQKERWLKGYGSFPRY